MSDSAVNILSKAAMNWRQSPQSQASGANNTSLGPLTPVTPQKAKESPLFGIKQGISSPSSAADLRKATKLAKVALNFTRKRGNTAHPDISNPSPFIFRNRSGLSNRFSARGIAATAISDGHDAQFQMNPINNDTEIIDKSDSSQRQGDTRLRKYDGHFPTVDITLEFDIVGTIGAEDMVGWDVSADPITGLPTDRVGRIIRSVRIWKKKKNLDTPPVSQWINIAWSVQLEENRRVLTLSSATNVIVFGCGPAVEVGVRLSSEENRSDSNEITVVGTTAKNNELYLPLWVEACFCQIDVFVRPSTLSTVYEWSTFPVLCLKEAQWNSDADVHYDWVAEALSTGGVTCPLTHNMEDISTYHPVWLQCTFSDDLLEKDFSLSAVSTTTVTIWSAMTIRNMLP